MAQIYICPMHSDVRQSEPGNCPKCGMALLPEGTRFALLRHMMTPRHFGIMLAAMLIIMAAVMIMRS
jgi:Cu+-exporting ATPase